MQRAHVASARFADVGMEPKDPLRTGAVNITTESFLRDQDADDAAS